MQGQGPLEQVATESSGKGTCCPGPQALHQPAWEDGPLEAASTLRMRLTAGVTRQGGRGAGPLQEPLPLVLYVCRTLGVALGRAPLLPSRSCRRCSAPGQRPWGLLPLSAGGGALSRGLCRGTGLLPEAQRKLHVEPGVPGPLCLGGGRETPLLASGTGVAWTQAPGHGACFSVLRPPPRWVLLKGSLSVHFCPGRAPRLELRRWMGGDSQAESMGDTHVCWEPTRHLHVGGPGFWPRDNAPTPLALPPSLLGGGPAEEALRRLLRRGYSWARRCRSSQQRLHTPGAPGGGPGGGRRLASLVDGFGHCCLGAASEDRPGRGGHDRDVHAPVPTCHPL